MKKWHTGSWIYCLSWDVEDDFYTAEAKVMARRQQIQTSRGL